MTVMTFKRAYWLTIILLGMSVLLVACTVSLNDPLERLHTFTRDIEFDYIAWTLNSLGTKLGESALGLANYLPLEEQSKVVLAALELIRQIKQKEVELTDIYADPNISDPDPPQLIFAGNWMS